MFFSSVAKVVGKAIKGLTQNEFFFAYFEQSLEKPRLTPVLFPFGRAFTKFFEKHF